MNMGGYILRIGRRCSFDDLAPFHEVQIVFGLISFVPLAVSSYILKSENMQSETCAWLLVTLSILLVLLDLVLLHATIEEVTPKTSMNHRLIQSDRLTSGGRLAAGVAHEILNPINIISGRTQLLLMEKEIDLQVHKTMAIIQDQTKRIVPVINNLRLFSNRSKEGVSPLNIRDLLNRVLTLLEGEIVDRLPDPFCTINDQHLHSGPGPSVSYGIIRNHGGTIRTGT